LKSELGKTGRAREGGPGNEKEGVELVRGHKMRKGEKGIGG